MSHPGRVMISVVAAVLATFGLLVAVWAGSEATPAVPVTPQPDMRAEVMARLPEDLPDEARSKLPQMQAELAQGVMGLLTPVQVSCLSSATRTDSGHARNR